MEQITTFDAANLKFIRTKLQAAINEACKELGITAQMKNIRFSDNEFKCPLECRIAGTAKQAVDYSELYPWMKLPKLGTQFRNMGRIFTVTAHKVNSPKYPVVAKDLQGKSFKFTVNATAEQFQVK